MPGGAEQPRSRLMFSSSGDPGTPRAPPKLLLAPATASAAKLAGARTSPGGGGGAATVPVPLAACPHGVAGRGAVCGDGARPRPSPVGEDKGAGAHGQRGDPGMGQQVGPVLPVCPSVHPSICPWIHPPICPSVHGPSQPATRPSICPSTTRPSVCPPLYSPPSVHLSPHQSPAWGGTPATGGPGLPPRSRGWWPPGAAGCGRLSRAEVPPPESSRSPVAMARGGTCPPEPNKSRPLALGAESSPSSARERSPPCCPQPPASPRR